MRFGRKARQPKNGRTVYVFEKVREAQPSSTRAARFGNRILDALPAQDANRLGRILTPVTLSARQTPCRLGEEIDFVYFPIRGLVSIVTPLADGSAVEVGTIGEEGAVGLTALLSNSVSPHDAVVQGTVEALRAEAPSLRHEFERSAGFRRAILRFTELFIEQVSQTAACNGRHRVEARCARWLLLMADQCESPQFPLTHNLLAALLGVRRTGVSVVAKSLQLQGAIGYSHGKVEILDRSILEELACECYFLMRERIDHFLR